MLEVEVVCVCVVGGGGVKGAVIEGKDILKNRME